VPEGLALVSLLPAGAGMQAQLYAPSSALGFIAVGQLVQLRLQAYPYQQFGALAGKVSQVALAPVPPAELASVVPLAQRPPESAAEPLYRVTVTLPQQTLWAAGAERPLLAGMQLEADVLLERRRLIEWLFEPLLGWRQRM
jgi:membrane fusion protein